jgi:hypothetical protein
VGHIDVEVFDVVHRIIAVFQQRYFRELDAKTEAWRPILWTARRGTVTLVYGSHDARYNQCGRVAPVSTGENGSCGAIPCTGVRSRVDST